MIEENNEEMVEQLRAELTQEKERQGYTLTTLGEKLGMTKGYVSYTLSKGRSIGVSTLLKFCKALDIVVEISPTGIKMVPIDDKKVTRKPVAKRTPAGRKSLLSYSKYDELFSPDRPLRKFGQNQEQ